MFSTTNIGHIGRCLTNKSKQYGLEYQVIRTEKLLTGWEVFRWPEFLAFAKRLGIDLEAATTKLVITLPVDGVAKIQQTVQADDIDQPNSVTPFDEQFNQ